MSPILIEQGHQLNSSKSSLTDPTRFLVASPNGNTGAVVYFVPVSNNDTSEGNSTVTSNTTSGLGASLVNSTLQSISGDNNQTGIQGELSISEDFDFGVTISKLYSLQHPADNQSGVSGPFEITSNLVERSLTLYSIGHWETITLRPLRL